MSRCKAVSYTHLDVYKRQELLVSYYGISKLTIAKMAGVEENDIDRLLVNPPEKVEIEVKYKIAVTVMELRFWLKDCELPI